MSVWPLLKNRPYWERLTHPSTINLFHSYLDTFLEILFLNNIFLSVFLLECYLKTQILKNAIYVPNTPFIQKHISKWSIVQKLWISILSRWWQIYLTQKNMQVYKLIRGGMIKFIIRDLSKTKNGYFFPGSMEQLSERWLDCCHIDLVSALLDASCCVYTWSIYHIYYIITLHRSIHLSIHHNEQEAGSTRTCGDMVRWWPLSPGSRGCSESISLPRCRLGMCRGWAFCSSVKWFSVKLSKSPGWTGWP